MVCIRLPGAQSALTGFEALVDLIDDVNATLAANQLVGAVTTHKGLERIADLHIEPLFKQKRGAARPLNFAGK
jgi:hypothetical protein